VKSLAAKLVSCVVYVQTSAKGRSLVQGSRTECVRVCVCVIKCNNNSLHLLWVGRRVSTKKVMDIIRWN
jgi:hypothetical protein